MEILSSFRSKGALAWTAAPAMLVIWTGASVLGVVDPVLLPTPVRVLEAVGDIGPNLALHVAATVVRVMAGFLICVVIGSVLGVWMQRNRVAYAILDGLIETWRPVPPVALLPFFLLIFGFSETGRMALIALGGTLVTTVTVVEALHKTPVPLVRLGLVLGLTRRQMFRLILIPAAIPRLAAGFRIALALVFSLVIVSEFLGAPFGLGYLISVAKVTLTTPTMLLCIIILGLIGFASDTALRATLTYLTRWEPTAREARL